jgi:TonB family protein
MKKIAIILIWTALISSTALSKENKLPCKINFPISLDSEQKPSWLENEQVISRTTQCTPPRYPDLARVARVQGNVILDIAVDPNGRIHCIKSNGNPLLEEAAIQAAKTWTYTPVQENGANVGFLARLVFTFSLDGKTPEKGKECFTAGLK